MIPFTFLRMFKVRFLLLNSINRLSTPCNQIESFFLFIPVVKMVTRKLIWKLTSITFMTELVSVGMALPIEYTSASTEKFSNLISTSGNVIPTLFLKHSDSTQPKKSRFPSHTQDIFISRYLSILSLRLSMRSSLS